MVKKGDNITELNFTDSKCRTYRLEDFSDKKAIALTFYPMDFTRICTAQVCHARDRYSEIRELGGEIFGVSMDSDEEHEAFIRRFELPFPLISDKNNALGKLFGTMRLGGILRNKRSTFILSPKGEILEAIHNELNADIHADRFIDILRTMDKP
jgi:peroxiredoxin Q/BCP